MNYVTLDVEATTKFKGNPFTAGNKLCLVGLLDKDGYHEYDIEYSEEPYGAKLKEIKERIKAADILIGFNLKYDLHWIRKYIPDVVFGDIYDAQLAEFILGDQTEVMPSLGGTSARRGLGDKLDVVANEYWAKGIDTTDVPWDVLTEYCEQDVRLTYSIFLQQVKELSGPKKRCFWLQCKDLLVLQDMEFHGLRFDANTALAKSFEGENALAEIDSKLSQLVGSTDVSWSSSDHISCVLYGGSIPVKYREAYTRTLKDGTIRDKERWSVKYVTFPRKVTPLPNTENAETAGISEQDLVARNVERRSRGQGPVQRHFSVGEGLLRRIRRTNKRVRPLIELLLERAKIEKLVTTYYGGLNKLLASAEWGQDIIHGQINQCVAVTGRTASSKPNLQNFAGDIKELFYSRYV